MRARAFIVGLIGLVGMGGGCAGTGEFSEPEVEPAQGTAVVSSTSRERTQTPREESASVNLVVRNYNLTLGVHDTAKAMGHAEKILASVGAEVMHSDRNEDNGNISATLPRGTSRKVLESLRVLGEVSNENTGVNDMRTAMHELRTKIRRLRVGEMALAELIRETTDADVVDALVAQLELSRREYESARQQIASHETQGSGDSLYVSFNRRLPEDELLRPKLRGKD